MGFSRIQLFSFHKLKGTREIELGRWRHVEKMFVPFNIVKNDLVVHNLVYLAITVCGKLYNRRKVKKKYFRQHVNEFKIQISIPLVSFYLLFSKIRQWPCQTFVLLMYI